MLASLFTIENLTVILGLLYIILLIKENILAWVFGFLTSIILTYISFTAKIYFHAILNFYYVLVPVYAYLLWRKKDTNNKPLLKIHEMKSTYHVLVFVVGIPLVFILSYLASKFSDSKMSLVDAAIFVFALIATIMQARKIISNWIYWIVINSATIFLFYSVELTTVIILPVIYTILPFFGYFNWLKLKNKEQNSHISNHNIENDSNES